MNQNLPSLTKWVEALAQPDPNRAINGIDPRVESEKLRLHKPTFLNALPYCDRSQQNQLLQSDFRK